MEAAKGDFGRLMAGYEVIVCAASWENARTWGTLSHDAYIEYSSRNPLKNSTTLRDRDTEVMQEELTGLLCG